MYIYIPIVIGNQQDEKKKIDHSDNWPTGTGNRGEPKIFNQINSKLNQNPLGQLMRIDDTKKMDEEWMNREHTLNTLSDHLNA